MRICNQCGKEFFNSFEFCTEDGSRLIESSAEDQTLVMEHDDVDDFDWKNASDAEQEQYLVEKKLFSLADFQYLKHDSRFERLLARLRQTDYTECTKFMIRLIGRSEYWDSKLQINPDLELLTSALGQSFEDETDQILRSEGLI